MSFTNLKLVPFSHLDSVALTVTSAHADYPVTYLQNSQPSWRWQSTSLADQVFTWQMSELTSADAFGLINGNQTEESTIRIELATDASYTTKVLDETIAGKLPLYGLGEGPLGIEQGIGGFSENASLQKIRTHFFDRVAYTYGRVTLSDSSNSDGYLEAGKIIVGASWSPAVNHEWGAQRQKVSASNIIRGLSGGGRATPASKYDVVTVGFRWLEEEDDSDLDDIIDQYGDNLGVLLNCYPGEGGALERKHTTYGLLTGWSPSQRNRTHKYSRGFNVEELK